MPEDLKRDIEVLVSSCTRNKYIYQLAGIFVYCKFCRDGKLEITSSLRLTRGMAVSYVSERSVHKFSLSDGCVVNYITQTEYFSKDSDKLPPGHCCHEIEVPM